MSCNTRRLFDVATIEPLRLSEVKQRGIFPAWLFLLTDPFLPAGGLSPLG